MNADAAGADATLPSWGGQSSGRELVLPNGAMQLLVNLDSDRLHSWDSSGLRTMSGAALQGARSGPAVIDAGQLRAMVGVAFKPGGAFPFATAPPSATAETMIELDTLWGRDGAVLRERLLSAPSPQAVLRTLEKVLLAKAVRPLQPDPAIAVAVAAFEGGATVNDVTDRLGMTSKRFIRRFADRVGLTPKRFSRVRRFQRLLDSVPSGVDVDWARRAVECGYYDQSHLVHEFHALAGLRPTQYQPRTPSERNHVPQPEPSR